MGCQAAEADPRWYGNGTCNGLQVDVFADAQTGKILKDEDTVETYKIEEKGFVVCVVNKVRICLVDASAVCWTCR